MHPALLKKFIERVSALAVFPHQAPLDSVLVGGQYSSIHENTEILIFQGVLKFLPSSRIFWSRAGCGRVVKSGTGDRVQVSGQV